MQPILKKRVHHEKDEEETVEDLLNGEPDEETLQEENVNTQKVPKFIFWDFECRRRTVRAGQKWTHFRAQSQFLHCPGGM